MRKTNLAELLRPRSASQKLEDIDLTVDDYIYNADGSIDYFSSRVQAAANRGVSLEKLVL